MVWSYSRVTSFAQCKYQFYLKYIVADDSEYLSEGNFYAELGSYVHKILEMVFKGELSAEDALQYYLDHFDENVFYQVRESIMKNSFEACADYFAELDLNWLSEFEILGVEQKIETEIAGHPFIGFIDLLVRHKKTGEILLIDHKSAKCPISQKTGNLLKKQESAFRSYQKQMYLYCKYVKEKYGAFPKCIAWNHFKENEIVYLDFNPDDYCEALEWFEGEIHKIETEEDWAETIDYFYCHNLCEFRSSCEYARYERNEGDSA